MTTLRADVCIVGSGAGGAPVAQVLTQSGLDVLVLERGRSVSRADFAVADETRNALSDGVWKSPEASEPYFQADTGTAPLTPSNGLRMPQVLGGSTNFWGGYASRLRPVDFELVSRYGAIAGSSACDWPIKYADLAPYYARAERELGVGGAPDPTRPAEDSAELGAGLLLHPLANLLGAACRKDGLHPFQSHQAILQNARPDRDACRHSGWCASYGCPTGAKGSAREVMLAAAAKTGKCRIETDLRVVKLFCDERDPRRIMACEALRGTGTERVRIEAKCFVLACRPVETARLLLCSAQAGHANGLANASDQVGRHLMNGMEVHGRAYFIRKNHPEMGAALDSEAPFCSVTVPDYYEHLELKDKAAFSKGGTLSFYRAGHSAFELARGVLHERVEPGSDLGSLFLGTALRERLQNYLRDACALDFECAVEFLPQESNRVTLHPSAVDDLGVPCPVLRQGFHPASVACAKALGEQGLRIFKLLGADHVQLSNPFANVVLSYGTCRFGTDPARSVLDPNCRAHDLLNLYVTDGSFMPTSGGTMGTLTIFANAYRVAEKIRAAFPLL